MSNHRNIVGVVAAFVLVAVWAGCGGSTTGNTEPKADGGADGDSVDFPDGPDPGPGCGNGRIDEGEVCDGEALGGQSCSGFGFPEGELRCNDRCRGFLTGQCAGTPTWTDEEGEDGGGCRACPKHPYRKGEECQRFYCDTPVGEAPPDTPISATLDVEPLRTLTIRFQNGAETLPEVPHDVFPAAPAFSGQIRVRRQSRLHGISVDKTRRVEAPFEKPIEFELPEGRYDVGVYVDKPGGPLGIPATPRHGGGFTIAEGLRLDGDKTFEVRPPRSGRLEGKAAVEGLEVEATHLIIESPHDLGLRKRSEGSEVDFDLPYYPETPYRVQIRPELPIPRVDAMFLGESQSGPENVVYEGPLPPPGDSTPEWTLRAHLLEFAVTFDGEALPEDVAYEITVENLESGQRRQTYKRDGPFGWVLLPGRYRLSVTLDHEHYRKTIEREVNLDSSTDLGTLDFPDDRVTVSGTLKVEEEGEIPDVAPKPELRFRAPDGDHFTVFPENRSSHPFEARVAPGTYDILAGPTMRTRDEEAGWKTLREDVELTEDRSLELVLGMRSLRPVALEGRLTLNGRPPSDHLPIADTVDGGRIAAQCIGPPCVGKDEVDVEPDGRFALEVPPGSYEISYSLPDHCEPYGVDYAHPFVGTFTVVDPSFRLEAARRHDFDVNLGQVQADVAIEGTGRRLDDRDALSYDFRSIFLGGGGGGLNQCNVDFAYETSRASRGTETRVSAPALPGCHWLTIDGNLGQIALYTAAEVGTGGPVSVDLPIRRFEATLTWDGNPWSESPWARPTPSKQRPYLTLQTAWMERDIPLPPDGHIQTWTIGEPTVEYFDPGSRLANQTLYEPACGGTGD